MLIQLALPLQSGDSIRLQGDFSGTTADFRELSRLTGGTVVAPEENPHSVAGEKVPPEAVTLYQSCRVRICCDVQNFTVYQEVKSQERLDTEYGVFVWHGTVLAAALSALLRGENVLLVHCAMLEKDGNALLLCGESGVGKSTTSRRWRACGNQVVSDDMILLEFGDNGIYAHRLPTWSACRESGTADKSYPFDPPLKLKNILALGRSKEREHIGTIPEAEFLGQLYHCAHFHYAPLLAGLPEDLQYRAAAKMRELFNKMAELSPPRVLLAALDGDLTESLRGVL